jgi:hypothetical protein
LLQQFCRACGERQFLLEMRDTLAERQIEEKLDQADQITAPAAPMTIEQILAGVDIERRSGVAV